jgi:hypothetical protein
MIPIPDYFLNSNKSSELGPFETKKDGPVRIEVVGIPEFKVQIHGYNTRTLYSIHFETLCFLS